MSTRHITFEGVAFGYRTSHGEVLSGLNLELRKGEFFLLLGPSGCGKTTVLNLLAGFERPPAGQISVGGTPVTAPGPDRVVIFQGDDSLLGWLSTVENVEFGLVLAGVLGRSAGGARNAPCTWWDSQDKTGSTPTNSRGA